MNIAGPLASLIFGLTVLTVFGGLFAYGVYKARERKRKPASAAGPKALTYFTEYRLPSAEGEAGAPAAPRRSGDGSFAMYVFSACALVAFAAAGFYYVAMGRKLVLQGGWQRWGGQDSAEFPAPPELPRTRRGENVSLAAALTRAPALVPRARYDANGDGALSAEERTKLHAEVPQYVLVTVNENGHVQGLKWLYEILAQHGVWKHATFFLTGNYLEGRPSYLGGQVSAWWSVLAQDNFVGLHGQAHVRDTEDWSADKWAKENGATLADVRAKVDAPPGWSWTEYPWGSRAPYLTFNDDYFVGLERLSPSVAYDASMVVHPARAADLEPRDETWPFSLGAALPGDVELPFSPKLDRRVKIGTHPFVEVPVYAWALRKKGASYTWEPSLDTNYFAVYPCDGDEPNELGLADFEANVRAHYEGNRAPFHIGLHAQNYTADRVCARATLAAMFARLDGLAARGIATKYESIPRFVAWLEEEKP